MKHIMKLGLSTLLATLLFSGCDSNSSAQKSTISIKQTNETYLQQENNLVLKSINNTKRNLQRELIALEQNRLRRSETKVELASVIATFVNDDLSDNSGAHYNPNAVAEFFESNNIDVSTLSKSEMNEVYIHAYFNAVSDSFGVDSSVEASNKRGLWFITKFQEVIAQATQNLKNTIIYIVDNDAIVSNITASVFRVMLQNGALTKEMLKISILSRTMTSIMIEVMDDHWDLSTQMQALLENDVEFGHLFMDLAKSHDYIMADFLFGRIDAGMYYSLTKAMTLSREANNQNSGKMTQVLSELMSMPRMSKFFNVPKTLEYTDAQSSEAFSKLLFSNGTTKRGDASEMANERFFYEIFATPSSTANFITAMNNIDEDIRISLMDQIFLGESVFNEADEMQGYYNIYAITGGMAYGLGEGAINFEKYKDSFLGFAGLVPWNRYLSYGFAFSKAGYAYYKDDNQAYIDNYKSLVYGTMFDFSNENSDEESSIFDGTYSEIYTKLGEYFDSASQSVLSLFNDMSFDKVYHKNETKIQYFLSNSEEVNASLISYEKDEYTSTMLYSSEENWAYIPTVLAKKDWIIQNDESSLELKFSFSSGYVTGYIISPQKFDFIKMTSDITFSQVELYGDEPLSSDVEVNYYVYSTRFKSEDSIVLDWQDLGIQISAIFFDADNAIANESVLK